MRRQPEIRADAGQLFANPPFRRWELERAGDLRSWQCRAQKPCRCTRGLPRGVRRQAANLGGLKARMMGPGVGPRMAGAEPLDGKLAPPHIEIVEVGDLVFAARRRFDLSDDLGHAFIVEIKTD